MIACMKLIVLAWLAPLLVLAVACGPYRSEADATAAAGDRIVAAQSAGCATAIAIDDDAPPPGVPSPTAYFPNGTPTPYLILRAVTDEELATVVAEWTAAAAASASATPDGPVATSTACADASGAPGEGACELSLIVGSRVALVIEDPTSPEATAVWETATAYAAAATSTAATDTPTIPPCPTVGSGTPASTETPAVIPAITSTPVATSTSTPPPTPEATGTSAVATATARASGQAAYLSIGDGLQWGCCGALGSSSPSLFRDYLEQRLGRPMIWQTSGSGYETTDTFITRPGGGESQLDFALTLIDYYRRESIPLAAITMSIGGNNLVDIGHNCEAPPCVDAFAAGLAHLREQLHVIYGRIAAAKDADTPLLVLLYYDANQCTGDGSSGSAVDAWNAVIAEVATQYGAFLVNARTPFQGHCDWFDANGLDANAAGHAAIAAEYERVYESLPAQYHLAQ
jgi:hypothetical protein